MPADAAVTITYLETTTAPGGPPVPLPDGAAVVRAVRPTASFYRFLYGEVGRPWRWTDRDRLSDAALEADVTPDDVHVLVLYLRGTPAGYAELDFRAPAEAQVVYFGLMPHAIGRGLGGPFLDHVVRAAWAPGVRRVWLHTCTLDHPRALDVYRRAGFAVYRRVTTVGGVGTSDDAPNGPA